ncbi:zinc-binding dehydrogenase [Serinibacter arcticus]|uniref:L-idonate 5-dehydrogenase n=1 Tax=Serinibacter arcticus TaxID=1655435 RepID=A0A4Z1E5T4_9MICO|nr:zinc-binding dehydrogenase [Serinibacter arcticus]TGO06680.1 L-idonate 5-dehydrogenase [Serinibacter arcticus]
MRAVVIEQARHVEVRDLPDPRPGPDQVLLRVAYVGICGSDLNYYHRGATGEYALREPLVPGHELSATVELDPTGALAPGTPVTVHPARFGEPVPGLADAPHLWPGGSYLGSAATWPHTQGAACELLVVERSMVRVLPPGLTLRLAALAEPLAVALHGIALGGGVVGRRVLVSGAGPIGLLAVAACVAQGASEVVASDVLAAPLQRARALGAAATVNLTEEEVPASSFDVVLECSGAAAAVTTAVSAARRRGTVVQLGMLAGEPRPINLAPMLAKELTMVGTFRFADEIDDAVAVLAAHPGLEFVITHEFGIDDDAVLAEAFTTARDGDASGKVLLRLAGSSRG